MSEESKAASPFEPPTMRTRPSGNRPALCCLRGEESCALATMRNELAAESNTSSVLLTMAEPSPPANSTSPLLSSVAVWPVRGEFMSPTACHLFFAGSYASAIVRGPELPEPPAINTRPSDRATQLWPLLGADIGGPLREAPF